MTTDKAVVLAEKHGLCGRDSQGLFFYRINTIAPVQAMLADHRQQIIDELAQRSGKMPSSRYEYNAFCECDGVVCNESEVREAIAAMQAQIDAANNATEFMRETGKAAHNALELVAEKLEQSEARVAELEKKIRAEIDHALVNDLRLTPAFGRITGDNAVRVSSLEAVFDAMNKEQP